MKIELVSYLALEAGLNSDKLKADYFQIHIKTWQKKQKSNQLKKNEWDALKAKAGYLMSPGWEGFKIYGERIYSSSGQFVTITEIESMWIYRQLLSLKSIPESINENLDKRLKPILKLV